jgi:DNA replication licensing factor MCM2
MSSMSKQVFKKYIIYAKKRFDTRMTSVDQEKIAPLYANLRRQPLITCSIPVTVRRIESMVPMDQP